MFSIHYISTITICNITGNAIEPWILVRMHMAYERYQQNHHRWQTWLLGFQWHRKGIVLIFKSLDCFIVRLFHSATILLHMYIVWNFTRLMIGIERYFSWGEGRGGAYLIMLEKTPAPMYIIWGHIFISRPLRVIRCFKRRSYQTYRLIEQMHGY